MSRNKELAKNTFIIFVGTICTKLMSFFLLPLYTGILTTAEYGTVDLLTTLISLISPIISLQISQSVFRYLIDNRNNEEEKKQLISVSIFFVIFNTIIYLLLFIFISPLIHNDYKYYLATNVIASIFCDLLLQISRGLGNNREYSIAGVITAIITILCNIIFLVGLQMRVNGMLIGTLIGYIIGIFYLFIKLNLHNYIFISKLKISVLKKMLNYSLPLVPNQLSWWVFGMSDRVIVSFVLGLSLTGILSVSYKFSSAYIMLYNIFNISWTESMALHINDKDVEDYFNKTFNTIFTFFISLGILLIAVMPFAFKILVNERYKEALHLIPIAILAAICQVVVGLVSVIYVSKNDTKAIANTAVCAAIVNVFVHGILIKYIGIYAAVFSTFVSYLTFSIYRTIDVRKKYLKIRFDIKKMSLSISIIIIVLVTYYMKYNYLKIMTLIIAIAYMYIVNKKSLKSIITLVKHKIGKEVQQ